MSATLPLGQIAQPLPFPADTETMFADHKGRHRPGIEKRQRKLAAKVAFIGRFLRKDERVHLITTACSPFSTLEQLTTGWSIIYLKRALLVVTNERILHVLTNSNFTYRHSLAEVRFPDCASVRQSFSALKVEYRSGKKERFLYVARSERRRLKDLFAARTFGADGAASGKRTHLCPRCAQPLQEDVYTCGSCRLEFKSREDGRRIALIYPGGGYFYTGHWLLGTGDAITEFVLIVMLILALIGAGGEEPGGWGAVAFFGFLLVIEKAISVYHTNHFIHEYIPKEKITEQSIAPQ